MPDAEEVRDSGQAFAGASYTTGTPRNAASHLSCRSITSVPSYSEEELFGRGFGPLRIFGSLLPIVYLIALPSLSETVIGSDGETFARRCKDFPNCRGSATGVSLSSLIKTPQATGAMFAVFFWPVLHLWLPGAVLTKIERQVGTVTLLLLVVGAGLLVVVQADVPGLDLIWSLSTIAHFCVMLRQCHRRRRPWCVAMLSLMVSGCLGFGMMTVLGMWTKRWVAENLPWVQYGFVVVALSAFALFPLVWHRARPLTRRTARLPEDASGNTEVAFNSVIDTGMSSLPIKLLGSMAAIVYIWTMPLLANFHTIVHRCRGYPYCLDKDGVAQGPSVSDFICTPAATGLMGATFFWPIMHFWMPGAQAPESRLSYLLLIIFQLNFGAFLMAPVEILPAEHFVVVGSFCVSALAHFAYTSKYCLDKYFYGALACLAVAALMVVLLVTITVVWMYVDKDYYLWNSLTLWSFYLCEAIGLTAIITFPIIWRRDQSKWHGRALVVRTSFTGFAGGLLAAR